MDFDLQPCYSIEEMIGYVKNIRLKKQAYFKILIIIVSIQ
jgi:hypothetical protein